MTISRASYNSKTVIETDIPISASVSIPSTINANITNSSLTVTASVGNIVNGHLTASIIDGYISASIMNSLLHVTASIGNPYLSVTASITNGTVTASLPTNTFLTATIKDTVPVSLASTNIINVNYTPSGAFNIGNDMFSKLRTSFPHPIISQRTNTGQYSSLMISHKIIQSGSRQTLTGAAVITMKISGTSGDGIILQSKDYFKYQPGTSYATYTTFCFSGTQDGVVKRVGYFDEKDGYYIELSSSDLYLVQRSSVTFDSEPAVITKISQSAWNYDKMDGTGLSKINLNNNNAMLLNMDFISSIGLVRCGFVQCGEFYTAHIFNCGVATDRPYVRTLDLPMRFEVSASKNTVQSGLNVFGYAINVEGDHNPLKFARTINCGTASLATDTTQKALILMRLKDGLHTPIEIFDTEVMSTTVNANFLWQLQLNPVLDSIPSVWQSRLSSSVEYVINFTGSVLSEGIKLASGYGSTTTSKATSQQIDSLIHPCIDVNGNKDIVALTVRRVTGGSADFYGSLDYCEYK